MTHNKRNIEFICVSLAIEETRSWQYTRQMRKQSISPVYLIPLSFLAAIVVGTLLLMLPFASSGGHCAGFLTALFTAASAVCVTGLVVTDTYSSWSIFGQMVIMLLIQAGGMGIISVAAILLHIAHRKFSLGYRLALQGALNVNQNNGILSLLVKIFKGTLFVELVGAVFLALSFIPHFGFAKGLWASLFNAVSAFCNAGFDILGPDSLVPFKSDLNVLATTTMLNILGGLGFVVWFDLHDTILSGFRAKFSIRQIFSRLTEHTKLAICLTFGISAIGALLFFAAEYGNPGTIGSMSLTDKILNSIFEAAAVRTSGFSTFPQGSMTDLSSLALCLLMFIGGSPISTAGGVKTVTFFLVFMNMISYIKGEDKTTLFRKKVSSEIMRKAAAIVAVSALTAITFAMLLMAATGFPLKQSLFEAISAISTTGASLGITQHLNATGMLIITLAMYLGRIGPISMAIMFSRHYSSKNKIQYAEGNFFVG